jgi:hypothetical protein
MTNERHEKALEAAFDVFDADGHQPDDTTISKAIATYLQVMDAVIVPREPTDYMITSGIIAYDGNCETSYRAMLSAAPHHFNQEGK